MGNLLGNSPTRTITLSTDDPVPSPLLDELQDVAISRWFNGYYGTRTGHRGPQSQMVSAGTYTPSVTSNVPSMILSTGGGTVYLDIQRVLKDDRLKSVTIRALAAAEPTITLYDQVGNAAAALTTATSGGPITGTGTITHTISSVINGLMPQSANEVVWVKIVSGASTVQVYGIDYTFDRPFPGPPW